MLDLEIETRSEYGSFNVQRRMNGVWWNVTNVSKLK